jgi:ethanolamine ammonia-lyase small subunit
MAKSPSARPDPWLGLRAFTAARIALGRAGGSIPTGPLLEFQLAHARARDAVGRELDGDAIERTLRQRGWDVLRLHSAAPDRRTFVQRPDLGRILGDASKAALESRPHAAPDAVLVIADGLSALAVERHAVPLLDALGPAVASRLAARPVCIVREGRVAIGDEIGALVAARRG